MIGPIKGEMSMAPMITAVELILRPMEAIKIAKIKVHKAEPEKLTPRLIDSMVPVSSVSFLI